MNLFYDKALEERDGVLGGDEARHCFRVLRLRAGDAVHVTDGRGRIAEARLTEAGAVTCRYTVESSKDVPPRNFTVHIALAPPKSSDRLEWFLEKATECGIETVTPLLCSRSERTKLNYERLGKILAGAMKQSLRAYLPALREVLAFRDFIQDTKADGRFIAHRPYGTSTPRLKTLCRPAQETVVLIGPEGGFTDEEVKAASAAGFRTVSLGPARLRTETAALTACQILNILNDE